jgi:hypothetical protein
VRRKCLPRLHPAARGSRRCSIPTLLLPIRSYYLPLFEAAARYFKVEPIVAPVHSDARSERSSPRSGMSREAASS